MRADRAAAGAALLLALGAAGCGGDDPPRPKPPAVAPADPSAVAVIRRWADTLRAGRPRAAAGLFAVPSLVANGTPLAQLRTRAETVAFNRSLPCGATLVGAKRSGGYVVATFRLTDRPGGNCGTGGGQPAAVAFAVAGGRIEQWRRVAVPRQTAPPPRAPHDDPSRSV